MQVESAPPAADTASPTSGSPAGAAPPPSDAAPESQGSFLGIASQKDVDALVDRYGPMAADYGVRVLGVLVLLVIALFASNWAKRVVSKGLARAKVEITLAKFFSQAAKWIIMVLAIVTALGVFGVNTTSLAAVVGAAGLAVGLAMQGALSNLAAGLMLLIFRPFRVGQVVEVDGNLGTVDEIELFTTRINRFDNRHIIVPNSRVFGNTIEVLDHNATRRVDVPVGAAYDADVDATRAVLESAAKRTPGALSEPAPAVVLTGFADSCVNWEVRVWVRTPEFLAVRQALLRSIKLALDEAGIGIPFPQRDMNITSPVEVLVRQA
jgi:small conductance mechanosensitive channel